jgi:hypothetical protein
MASTTPQTQPGNAAAATPHLRDLLAQLDRDLEPTRRRLAAEAAERAEAARRMREVSAAWEAAQAWAPVLEWPAPAPCKRDWACYLADGHQGGCCRD